ncbi:MAG: hypothetical protein HQ515_06990, partial [Phycisphaeraceae bacterium]|nr:hypothetical protein [Phycisphaeraceae bacterium]
MAKPNIRIRKSESTRNPKSTGTAVVIPASVCLVCILAFGSSVQAQQASKTDPNKVSVSLLMVPETPQTSTPAVPRRDIPKLRQQPKLKATSSPANRLRMLEILDAADESTAPVNATQLITLPKLSAQEIADLSNRLELHLSTKLGYRIAPPEFVDTLPASPKGI